MKQPFVNETKSPSTLNNGDQDMIQGAAEVLTGQSKKGRIGRILPFLGPAFIASVAYIDPGNFATNIQAGAKFGYILLWVIVASNLTAMLIQTLSAKLGITTGKNLAELCRLHFPRPLVLALWVLMELVAMATDLAEFLGAALGFNLLFGIPLWLAGLLTALTTFIILGLEQRGIRPMEAVIVGLISVVAVCYLIETVLDRPAWMQVLSHALVPQFTGKESVLLATGILGATVMPHAIFLHSALTQHRVVAHSVEQTRRLYSYERLDVLIAMTLAGLVNAAMLIMAAATFFRQGLTDIGTIEEAHRTLQPLLGPAASWVFALSLLMAGLSSSSVGTMAGQIIMQGFLEHKIPVWIRRLVTLAPSIIVISLGVEPTRTLVMSQVVLSFGLPFAVIPLVLFTSRKELMGQLVNRRITTMASILVAGAIIALNLFLLIQIL
jgi:manganese transport protein